MVARVATVAFGGIEVLGVDVQVQIGAGMPGFALVIFFTRTAAAAPQQ